MLQQVLASVESLNKTHKQQSSTQQSPNNSPTQQSGAFIIATHLDKIKNNERIHFIESI